jgi:hypothetical protein
VVLLVALIFIARLVLFSTAVSVEPRYVVEFFPISGGHRAIGIFNFKDWFMRVQSQLHRVSGWIKEPL